MGQVKYGFSNASQLCDSASFKNMNILASKCFLFEFKRTFGSDVMVDLLKVSLKIGGFSYTFVCNNAHPSIFNKSTFNFASDQR